MKNIVLIGFMGSGKTSTGRILANRLGRGFIDLDQKIEEAAQMSIKEMFAQHGEAYFRQKEREMVCKMSARRSVVISTGGGTVKDPENVTALRENGVLISLYANVDVILERTSRRGTRPVLDGKDHGDRRQAIEELLAARETLYEQADYRVDTSQLSPMQVADEILCFLKREGIIRA